MNATCFFPKSPGLQVSCHTGWQHFAGSGTAVGEESVLRPSGCLVLARDTPFIDLLSYSTLKCTLKSQYVDWICDLGTVLVLEKGEGDRGSHNNLDWCHVSMGRAIVTHSFGLVFSTIIMRTTMRHACM